MKALRATLEAFRAALVDIGRRPLFSLLSIAAMTVAIIVLAAFLLLSRGARTMFGDVTAQAAVEIYFRDDATAAQADALAGQLEHDPAVQRVERVSREQALDELKRLYPDLGDVGQLLGDNPLPSSLRVSPRSPDPGALAGVVRAAREDPAVLSVRFDRDWLQSLARIGEALRLAAVLGSVVLLLSALVTVGAVVRLALDDKLDEIGLLRLVGAPLSFVLAPVLLGGGILGAAGAGLALTSVALGRGLLLRWGASTPLAPVLSAALGPGLPLSTGALLFAGAVIAGTVSATIAAGKTAIKA